MKEHTQESIASQSEGVQLKQRAIAVHRRIDIGIGRRLS